MIHTRPLFFVCRRISREADVVGVVRGEANDGAGGGAVRRWRRAVQFHVSQDRGEEEEHANDVCNDNPSFRCQKYL